ncbi:MAG: monofunctional biosynthetic peptidoglycan transglycosylase [Rubricoccaceae bacterium]|nr:monofunctional biosynthetic peptidoglycan transglycosylase [Rubricoccaceae bacterium]
MPKPSEKSKKRRIRPFHWMWRIVRFCVLLVVGYLLLCTLLLIGYRFVDPPITTVQIQRQIESIGDGFHYSPVDDSEQAIVVRRAVVAAEDARFYSHNGLDWTEIQNAREVARRRGTRPRGASTITQQLVKNLFLTTHRSWIRKGFEVPLTYIADLVLPKERILTLYMNSVEWGPGVFGIEEAAQYHYGISADQLSRNQAARLAACLPNPRERRPQNMGNSASRIMRRMSQMGW